MKKLSSKIRLSSVLSAIEHLNFLYLDINVELMKIPKIEDVVLDCLAVLSMIFLLSGLVRIVSNQSYGFLLLLIGVALLVVFTLVVANLRKKDRSQQ